MPNKCCVPGCKSNYASSREGYVPCFRLPEEQNQREKWIKRIPRKDLPLNNRTVVCIKHFSEDMVSLTEKYKDADGVWKEFPRRKALLLPNAVPHIFPNLPSYLSAQNVPARRNPEERKAKHLEVHTEQVQKWLDSDIIKDFESLRGGLRKELYENWLLHSDGNSVVFFICEFSGIPNVRVSVKITEDMICQVSVNQNLLTKYELKWILPSNLRLERWSQLQNILARYKDIDPSNVVTKEGVIDCIIQNFSTLKEIIKNSMIVDWDKKLCFLSEQFNLMFSEHRKYSPEMTIWAFMVFMQSPVCYTVIRETCFLTLPHPKYLQQLSASLKVSPACENIFTDILCNNYTKLRNDTTKTGRNKKRKYHTFN